MTATVASRIRSVTVYRCGALVTREAVVAAPGVPAPEAVRIGNLPLCLDDASVRVRVEPADGGLGNGGLPTASDVRVALDVAKKDERLPPPPEEEIRAARLEEKRIQDRVEANRKAHDRLALLILPERPPGEEGKPPPPSPTAARLAFLEFRESRLRELTLERRGLEIELKKAQERRADLEAKQLLSTSARQTREGEIRKSAVVSLRSDASSRAVGARLVLEYMVPGARWAPSYAFRFDGGFSRADLEMRAMVGQNTGEDWDAVPLTLSTADPLNWTELPELSSIRIGRRQPAPPRAGWRPAPEGVNDLYADFDLARKAPRTAAILETAGPPPTGGFPDAGGALQGYISEAEAQKFLGLPAAGIGRLLSQRHIEALDRFGRKWFRRRQVNKLRERMDRDPMFHESITGTPHPRLAKKAAIRTLNAPSTDLFLAMEEIRPSEPATEFGGVAAGAAAPPTAAFAAMAPPPPPAAAKARGPVIGAPVLLRRARHREEAAPAETAADFLEERTPAPFDLPPPEPELAAPDRLLRYGTLRMPGPEENGRGRLRPADPAEAHVEDLSLLEVEISFDVKVVLAHAVERARTVERLSPPPRHAWPASRAGFDYAFPTDAPASIPSDGQFHSVPVFAREAPAARRFICVPREAPDAFRVVEFTNPLDLALPDGPADVLVGGDFVLTSPLHDVAPQGRVRLGLGVEPAIKIARNTKYTEAATGFTRGWLDLVHEITIDVVSHLGAEAEVEIRERLPVPKEGDEEVKVKTGTVSPPWEEWRPDEDPTLKGGRRWSVKIGPGEKKSLAATYTVQISARNEVEGGNRRE